MTASLPRPKAPAGHFYDPVLRVFVSFNCLEILKKCPIDAFFTSHSTGLHGSSLKALAVKGFLNIDPTKDGLGYEYYLNNHGHRLRIHATVYILEGQKD